MASTISSFAFNIKGDVVTPDHPEYVSAISRWAKNSERKAQVVVFVKDAQDVALSIAYAKESGFPIAIRGGGHNAAGASSSDGLVIDLSRYLNKVRVDEEKKLAYVGGGSLWKDVDAEAIKYGLATVGGTVNHTGVGGLTLGGGYGWLSGRHGLTIDNLRQVTIVTADGSILTASDTENTDLFWGVRGGGSNFGVVTEFVYQLYPQRRTVFAGFLIFTPDKVEQLIKVTQEWWERVKNTKEDEAMAQGAIVSPEGHPCMFVILFYNGSEEEGRANFKDVFDIGPIQDLSKQIPYEELNGMQSAGVPHGKSYYLKGLSQKTPNYESTMQVLNKNVEIVKQGEFIPTTLFEYVPLAKVNAVPVEATAFRRELTANILTILTWEGAPEKTLKARNTAKEIIDIIIGGQDSLTSSQQNGYSNYDFDIPVSRIGHPSGDAAGQKSEAAFGSNYRRLQSIKQKYDPENIFNRWFPISPLA